jgi:glycosyltransferase involved in cell wall biosynthesis
MLKREVKMPDKILVFIPCYNCEPQVSRVLQQFDQKTAGYFSEILLLDNGSRDNTLKSAIDAAHHVRDIRITIGRNRENYNLGGSHKAAFEYATKNNFSHVVVLHGDDQGSIQDLLPVLRGRRHQLHDACLGARFMSGSKVMGYSKFRIFGNRVFNFIFTSGVRTSIKDLGSGLNIFGKSVIEDKRIARYADDLRFNIYLLLGMLNKKLSIEYFPISWREDDQVSNVKMVSQALQTLHLLWQSRFQKNRFWMIDHRNIHHQNYEFDVVYSS